MIKFKEYNFKNIIGREKEILDDFATLENINEGDCIGDTINYLGEQYSDVYWAKGEELQGYIKSAVNQGLVDMSQPFTDIEDAFFQGCYLYLTDVLYENLYELVFNIALQYLNKDLDIYPNLKKNIENNTEIMEDKLEMAVDHIYNNNNFEDIIEAVDNLIKEYYTSGELLSY